MWEEYHLFLARIGTPVYFNRTTKQINSDVFSDTLCSSSWLAYEFVEGNLKEFSR